MNGESFVGRVQKSEDPRGPDFKKMKKSPSHTDIRFKIEECKDFGKERFF